MCVNLKKRTCFSRFYPSNNFAKRIPHLQGPSRFTSHFQVSRVHTRPFSRTLLLFALCKYIATPDLQPTINISVRPVCATRGATPPHELIYAVCQIKERRGRGGLRPAAARLPHLKAPPPGGAFCSREEDGAAQHSKARAHAALVDVGQLGTQQVARLIVEEHLPPVACVESKGAKTSIRPRPTGSPAAISQRQSMPWAAQAPASLGQPSASQSLGRRWRAMAGLLWT